MVEWPLLLGSAMGFGPALAVILFSFAPYDGHFRDNVLFLFFMGGIFGGMGVAVFELLLRLPSSQLYLAAMVLLGFPLLEQLLKLLVLNRKKHQGDRAMAFYGGAFGAGFASMLVLAMSQRDIPLARYADLGALVGEPFRWAAMLAVAVGLVLAHFATGLILGDAVRTRALLPGFARAVAALVPVQFFVFEFVGGLRAGREAEGVVWLLAVVAYAAALAWWAHARLLPETLPPDAHRKRRRLLRRQQREGAGP